MGHCVKFIEFDGRFGDLLTRENVVDFIDLLFEGPDSTFFIYGNETKKDWNGSCRKNDLISNYQITLSPSTIREHYEKGLTIGGNLPHDDIRVAIGSVLAHEIRHASQHVLYRDNSKFWSGKNYTTTPCEVDARLYADRVNDVIRSVFELEPRKKYDRDDALKLRTLMGMMREMDEIAGEEIMEMLGCIGMNNPFYNLQVIKELAEAGVKII